jgi:DNA modification methylase
VAITILNGDVLEHLQGLSEQSVHCCVTSPPYWGLRDYGIDGQIGLEETPEQYVDKLVMVFREIRRVLRDDGTVWLNLGDSYWGSGGSAGHTPETKNLGRKTFEYGAYPTANHTSTKREDLKPKDLVGIPWRVAFALQADGWYLRSDIIWSKPNPMPESVMDRPTKAHEYVFLLSKKAKYYYDADAVREPHKTFEQESKRSNFNDVVHYDEKAPDQVGKSRTGRSRNEDFNPNGRNRRTVWEIATQPTPEAHFATFPEALVEPCIKAGSKQGDTILDPFGGSGTTGLVARNLKRDCILIELNPAYVKLMKKKLRLNEQLAV